MESVCDDPEVIAANILVRCYVTLTVTSRQGQTSKPINIHMMYIAVSDLHGSLTLFEFVQYL